MTAFDPNNHMPSCSIEVRNYDVNAQEQGGEEEDVTGMQLFHE